MVSARKPSVGVIGLGSMGIGVARTPSPGQAA